MFSLEMPLLFFVVIPPALLVTHLTNAKVTKDSGSCGTREFKDKGGGF